MFRLQQNGIASAGASARTALRTTASGVTSSRMASARRFSKPVGTPIAITTFTNDHLRIEWKVSSQAGNQQPLPQQQQQLQQHSIFHYTWLRDNCQCAECMHPSTRQKLHSSAHVPFDIRPVAFVNGHDGKDTKLQVKTNDQPPQSHAITNDTLTITWNKPLELPLQPTTSHRSSFSLQWLRDNIYSDPLEVDRRRMVTSQHHTWTPADLTHVDLWSDYRKFILADNDNGNTPSEFRRVLDHLHRYGLAFLRNVPVEDHREVERVAERFGPIRDTLYGRSWDVRSVPDAKNIAYTSLFLDLHMDLMYFESPPALQFLHCLEASVDGGESIFLDSFKAVERLRAEDPAALAVLKRVPVTFHYMNNGHRMRYRRPTIIEGGMNEPLQVYYAPPFQGPLDGRPEDMAEFYAAFKKFSALVSDERMMVEHRLRPGECVIFANRRVLHGRRSFDSTSGKRWLKGTYVDQDVFHDRVEFAEHDRKKG